jgi:Ca-activated chloride channel family protein
MVTTYEKEVIAFNRRTAGKVREPLIAAYPQDGTIVADHPFAILDGTPWVTPEQVEAARIFREFLFTEDQQEALMETGLRPADSRVKIAPIDRNNGVNPGAVSVILEVPDVLAIERAVEVWDAVEKQADIALVFDRSGSMRGSKINAAAQGANAFLDSMDNEDWLMWLPFDNNPGQIHQGINGKVRESLKNIINSEIADGGTSLFDSIGLAYQTLETRRRVRGDSRRYGIVVLSDGEDTESNSFSLAQLEAMMRPTERDPTGIQIHAIGIGDDVDENVLTKLATASQGAYGTPDLENIEAIYRQISKYF